MLVSLKLMGEHVGPRSVDPITGFSEAERRMSFDNRKGRVQFHYYLKLHFGNIAILQEMHYQSHIYHNFT